MYKFLTSVFGWFKATFTSAKAATAAKDIQVIAAIAFPIVANIAALTGNVGADASVSLVQAAYAKYGVPLLVKLQEGNKLVTATALQNLAVQVVQKNLPPTQAGAATNIINSAVNLAVSGLIAA